MKIVVVGAGAAGLAAATRARRVNSEAEITVIEASGEFSRGTCSLPYYLSGEIQDAQDLQGVTASALSEQRIDLRLHTAAQQILPNQRKLLTQGETLSYDRLIVSTGSRPRSIEDLDISSSARGIWQLRRLADVLKIKQECSLRRIRRVAVLGGGYVGIEFAEALNTLGLEVSLFQRRETLMGLQPQINDLVLQAFTERGVRVHLETAVRKISPSDEVLNLSLCHNGQSEQTLCFDAVGLAQGIEPHTELLTEAGARLASSGATQVNARGETSLSNIYACGDGVELPNNRGGQGRWVPLATTAARLGRVCGENAAGGSLRLGSVSGSLSLRLFDKQLGVVGQAQDFRSALVHDFHWGSETSPFPRRGRGRGLLFTEDRTNRILGLQAFGSEAAALVDLVALCVDRDMTLEDLQEQDFSYNPPLSGLWHPLYLAARGAKNSSRQFIGGR